LDYISIFSIHEQAQVDLGLVEKYNVAGPRYTSYPPATKFTDKITWPNLAEKIAVNNQTAAHLSIYFHIPFCKRSAGFAAALPSSRLITTRAWPTWIPWAARWRRWRRLESATQSRATPLRRRLATFLKRMKSAGSAKSSTSTSIFVGHRSQCGSGPAPAHARAHGRAARDWFQPRSMGVQDSIPRFRKPSTASSRANDAAGMDWMRELGYGSINLDLIYGLPHQTPEVVSTRRSTPFWK